jgi:ornithine cyclodeaminase
MLIISKNDIKKLITMKDAIQSNKEALRMHAQDKCIVPLRTNIDIPKNHGQSLFMPAYIEEINAAGIKIASVFPKNIEINKPSVLSQMILLDGKTGEVCALIDGTYLTQLRTGALQGLATELLSKQDAKTAILFGTGGQAEKQLEAMLTVRNLETIHVFDIDFIRAEKFAEKMQTAFSQFSTQIQAVRDTNEIIKQADIITTITTSKKPIFDGGLIKNGAHVNGIGSYTPEMQELPASLILNADKILCDTKEGVLAEAGDIIIPMQTGDISLEDIHGDLGEVILGKIKGRETEDEITVFKAVGSALLDVVLAQKIYQKAVEQKLGTVININNE